MSKYDLQARTAKASGVTYEASRVALDQLNLYDRLGGTADPFVELSTHFYRRVFDPAERTAAPWFVTIFASSTQHEAVENQYKFLVQIFGGPDLYRQAGKGRFNRLVGRHANYSITRRAADRWMVHMRAVLTEDHSILKDDAEARQALLDYFQYTAHYIVVASEYMRSDQLSGGTSMDPGRVW